MFLAFPKPRSVIPAFAELLWTVRCRTGTSDNPSGRHYEVVVNLVSVRISGENLLECSSDRRRRQVRVEHRVRRAGRRRTSTNLDRRGGHEAT